MSAALARKLSSLLKYRRTFIDWPRAATMRYRERDRAEPVRLRLRGGGALWVRPRFDTVAMGELFVAESYAELMPTRPLRTVWDIGGNIGCFAIWLLRRQPDVQVTSFEPCAETFAVLSKNRDEFNGRAWQIRPFGLSDRNQTVEAFVPFDSYGQTSRHAESGIATQLPLKHIASVWEAEGRPGVDLLKIDCEGDEYEILAAMPDEMWNAVSAIVLEVHPRKDKQPAELRDQLAARGFRLRTGTVNPELWRATRD